jgi:hypothetical protein
MSTDLTVRMLELFRQQTETPRFLSGFFTSPARNFHNSEEVEIDILREDEEVAVAVMDITAGARENQATILTNKRFKPPVFKEAGPISAYELPKRSPGQDPFQDPNYQANALRASMDIARRCEQKVRRAVELMASDVLQTGTLTMKDAAGDSVFTMDFSPKTAHFPNAATTWDNAGAGDPIEDLRLLCNIIRKNGRVTPRRAIFGQSAMEFMLSNTKVQTRLDNRRMELGYFNAPELRGFGGIFHGLLTVGQYNLELWTYDQQYKDVETAALTQYVDPLKVIVMGDGRLDLTWGGVPYIGAQDSRVLPYLPGRISSSSAGIDLHQTAWLEKDNTSLTVQVAARPLTIPTAIDTFGCLTTTSS